MIEPRKVYRLESRGCYVCRRLHLPFRFWVRDEQVSTGSKNRRTCGRPLLGPGRSVARLGCRAGAAKERSNLD